MSGTPKVGYMPPVPGGFSCGNCKHFQVKPKGSGCDDKEVREELGQGASGLAPVDERGCCNHFSPKPRPKGGIGARLVQIGRA